MVGVSIGRTMPSGDSPSAAAVRRAEMVLMAMAAAGRGTLVEPVRIQKLLFLIDREIPHLVGGPHFNFRPCRYGPFDGAVFGELDALSRIGEVGIMDGSGYRMYALTPPGLAKGAATLEQLPAEVRRYLSDLARWVLSLSLGRLLAAIYHRFPEMATKSVRTDVATRFPGDRHHLPDRPFLEGMASAFDLTGSLLEPRPRAIGPERDAVALADDWRSVGDDLRSAMADFATGVPRGR